MNRRFLNISKAMGMMLLLTATILMASGCASFSFFEEEPRQVASRTVNGSEVVDDRRLQVVGSALAQLGTPYSLGGDDPQVGFDCSGLVHYVYGNAGIPVPRTAWDQFRTSVHKGIDQLLPGDLLFFKIEERTDHIAIYLGDGEFIHAPSAGSAVRLESMNKPYWRRYYRGVGSYL